MEFDWAGTADPTPYLCVPKALEHMATIVPGGWSAIMAGNRALALDGRRMLCEAIGVPIPCPDEMVGSIASIPLPDGRTAEIVWRRPDPIQQQLYDGWGFEVPVHSWPRAPKRMIRISAQLYNRREQYAKLAEALAKCLADEQ
jgi:isopenicillin-N epimerase